MARALNSLKLLALLALLCCAGCASWRSHWPGNTANTSNTDDGGAFGWLSDISANHWNFKSQPYDTRSDAQILGVEPSNP